MGSRRHGPRHCSSSLCWLCCVAYGQVAVQPRRNRPTPRTESAIGESAHRHQPGAGAGLRMRSARTARSPGLEKEHFKIFDDQVEQTITHFAMDDEPVAVGLVFDISGSMGPKLRTVAPGRRRSSSGPPIPKTSSSWWSSTTRRKLVVPLTRDVEEIQNQLTFAQSKGRTALLDAIMLAMHEMKKSKKNRKALLIISDGGDNSSRYTEGEVRNMVRESDVLIYAIGVFEAVGGAQPDARRSRGPGPAERNMRSRPAAAISRPTSTSCPTSRRRSASSCATATCSATRPTDRSATAAIHKVEIKVVPPRGLPKLTAHWRTGLLRARRSKARPRGPCLQAHPARALLPSFCKTPAASASPPFAAACRCSTAASVSPFWYSTIPNSYCAFANPGASFTAASSSRRAPSISPRLANSAPHNSCAPAIAGSDSAAACACLSAAAVSPNAASSRA